MNKREQNSVWLLAVIVAGAFVIRLWVAVLAYPYPGDGGHFVQHGIEYASGNESALSLYWSQGMTWLASRYNGIPIFAHRGLQYSNVAFGTLTVLIMGLIAWRLYRDFRTVLLCSLLGACSPILVQYSTNSYSEMAFTAFASTAFLLLVWDRRCSLIAAAVAGLSLGIAGNFKALDAAVWSVVALAVILVWTEGILSRRFLSCIVLVTLLVAGLYPVLHLTRERTGSWGLGSKSTINFVMGPEWTNSKVTSSLGGNSEFILESYKNTPDELRIRQALDRNDEVKQKGMVLYMLTNPEYMARRVVSNGIRAFRIYSEMLFMKGFRMGTWLLACITLLALSVVASREKALAANFPLIAFIFGVTGAICLMFVHERLLVPMLPIILIIAGRFVQVLVSSMAKGRRWLGYAVVLIYLGMMGVYATNAHRNEFIYWRYENLAQIGRVLQSLTSEEDYILEFGPHLALSALPRYPLRTSTMLYGDARQVGEQADQVGATLIGVSDQWRAHWPIAEVFEGRLPKGWRVLAIFLCEGDPRYGIPNEHEMILVREADARKSLGTVRIPRRPNRSIIP